MSATNGNGSGQGIRPGEAPTPAAAAAAPAVDIPDRPDPDLEILSVRAPERSMAPELEFTARVTDASPASIHLIALVVAIEIEPSMRHYDDEERERLAELFGEVGSWSSSTGTVRVARVSTVVGPFDGETTIRFPVPLGFDLEVAASKYLHALRSGEAPLRFHFNGTVYYRGPDGSLQLIQMPWDRSSRFSLPVSTWQEVIDRHYPNNRWVAVSDETLDRLRDAKNRLGAHSYSDAVATLLDRAEVEGRVS